MLGVQLGRNSILAISPVTSIKHLQKKSWPKFDLVAQAVNGHIRKPLGKKVVSH